MAQRRPTQETFGMMLRRTRLTKGLTQRVIARAIGMDFAYFSRLETGSFKGLPTRETIEKIAEAMNCTEVEKADLLAAAGRVSEEMQARPELRRLYRTATQLPSSELEGLIAEAEERLKDQQKGKGKGRKGRG